MRRFVERSRDRRVTPRAHRDLGEDDEQRRRGDHVVADAREVQPKPGRAVEIDPALDVEGAKARDDLAHDLDDQRFLAADVIHQRRGVDPDRIRYVPQPQALEAALDDDRDRRLEDLPPARRCRQRSAHEGLAIINHRIDAVKPSISSCLRLIFPRKGRAASPVAPAATR